MNSPIVSLTTEVIRDQSNPQLIVRMEAEDGSIGTGETWWGTYQPQAEPGTPVSPIAAMIDSILKPLCLAHDSTDIVGLQCHLYRATYQYGPEGITSAAIAGIDLAMWDLNARRQGVPVADVLGERARDRLPAYASLHWIGNAEDASADAWRAVQAGFTGVKLHEADAGIVLAVREAIGPDIALMVDISGRLSDDEHRMLAKTVESANVTWLEEPIFPQQAHHRLAQLRAAQKQRMAAGENEFGIEGCRRLLEAGAVDVFQPDIVKFGGLSAATELAALASKHGVWLCPHNFSLGPSLGANIHWSMTAKVATWIEVPFLSEGQSFAGSWTTPTLIDGMIQYPSKPGLDWD